MSAPVSPTSAPGGAASEPVVPSAAPAPRPGMHHLALRVVVLVVVTIVGVAVVAVGAVLLPLPGPGWLIIAGGLTILSTQFPVLRGPLRRAKVVAQRGVDEVAEKWWRTALAVATGVGMVGVGLLPFTELQIPYVTRPGGTFPSTDVEMPHLTWPSGAMIVAGGLFLVGLVVYARRTGGLSHPDDERTAGPAGVAAPAALAGAADPAADGGARPTPTSAG